MKSALDFFYRTFLLRDQSLMVKLSVFSGFLVVFPLIIFSLVSYSQFSKVLEREALHYNRQIIEQVQLYVERYLLDFEIETLKIINHPAVIRFSRVRAREDLDNETVADVSNVLKNAVYSRSDIVNYTIILDGIKVIDSAESEDKQSIIDLQKEYWYTDISKNGEPKIISRMILRRGKEEPVITIAKRIVNPQTLQPFGMLVLDVNYKRLHDVANRVNPGKTGFLYILNDDGRYVYHPDVSKIGHVSDTAAYVSGKEQNRGILVNDHFLTVSRSDMLKWNLVTSIPYEELMDGANTIRKTNFLTSMIFMAVAYVMAIGLAISWINPVKRLHRFIKRVEVGDFSGTVPVVSKDEIGMLTHGFNNMVDRLSSLMDEIYVSKLNEAEINLRQKDTELKMLQAQINPHFLYNSLDTIRGMALERDMEDISVMAASLAWLLRYNIKEEATIVAIQREIEIGEIYLRIQKYRFEEKLDYKMNIPEWASVKQIPKFTLQPLLENCIVHGLEPHTGKTEITITAEKINSNSFVLMISDTGPGIPNNRLAQITKELEGDFKSGNTQRIGVMNVHRRIQHIFGETYGIFIQSRLGEGTTVGIKLPL